MSDWARMFEGGQHEPAGVARAAEDVDGADLTGVAGPPTFLTNTNSS